MPESNELFENGPQQRQLWILTPFSQFRPILLRTMNCGMRRRDLIVPLFRNARRRDDSKVVTP